MLDRVPVSSFDIFFEVLSDLLDRFQATSNLCYKMYPEAESHTWESSSSPLLEIFYLFICVSDMKLPRFQSTNHKTLFISLEHALTKQSLSSLLNVLIYVHHQ